MLDAVVKNGGGSKAMEDSSKSRNNADVRSGAVYNSWRDLKRIITVQRREKLLQRLVDPTAPQLKVRLERCAA